MLRWRLLGAVTIIIPVLGLLWLDDQYNFGRPGIWFALLAVLLGVVCTAELSEIIVHGGHTLRKPATLLVAIVGMLIMVVPRFWHPVADGPIGTLPVGWSPIALACVVALILFRELFYFQSGQGATERIAMGLLASFYVLIPFIFMMELRMDSPDRLGMMSVVSVIFIAKFADAGAYFTGRKFGKRPLAPVLSPKKTIEGAVGGILVAMIAGAVFLWLILPNTCPPFRPANGWAPFGLAVSVAIAGMVGDLSVSLFKRDANMKDSARLLPGLGGGLDILDSILWAAPVGYLWWASGTLGG